MGLDYDAFLRAVLLPQGRFQALLQATDGERASILKGIFRLDLLERMRDSATSLLDRVEPELQKLEARRSVLLPDPASTAAAAAARHEDEAKLVGVLDAALTEVRATAARCEEARRLSITLADTVKAVRGEDLAGIHPDLARLVTQGEKLDAASRELGARIDEIARDDGELGKTIAAAEKAGLGVEALLGATRTLQDIVEWLGAEAKARARLDAADAATVAQEQAIASLRDEVGRMETRLKETRTEVETTRKRRDAASSGLEEARRRWSAAREASGRVRELETAHTKRAAELAGVNKELTAARRAAEKARGALAKAEERLAESQRRHAAAHAAAGLAAGDPCPICDRKLPASWRVPAAADAAAAKAARESAVAEEKKCGSQLSALEERTKNLGSRLAEDKSTRERADRELVERLRLLREVAGKSVEVDQTENAVIAPLARASSESERRLEAAVARAGDEEKKHRERSAVLERAIAELTAARKQITVERARLEQERAERKKRIANLAERLRPSALEADAVSAVSKRAETELRAARERQTRHQSLLAELTDLQTKRSELKERAERDVLRPTRAIARSLGELRQNLAALASRLEASSPPQSDHESTSEVAAWARELDGVRDRLLESAAGRARELERDLAGAETAIRKVLESVAVESEPALVERRNETEVRRRLAAEELAQAKGQIEEARRLDRRVAAGRPFLDALRELRSLLTDGRFVGYVVERKQRSLLAVASKLLGGMTNERYAFAEDFQIIDRVAGEPRSTKTLSGGETFLASLALALGLVELAGREGGRLDSLFLDEGFGSLDANALTEALDALHDQAAKGRMVVVISHLRAVAESLEDVLLVTRDPAGSRAAWLSDAERVRLVEEEASLGLLV